MTNKIILWALFILPWITLIFLDRSVVRRYISVALFVTVINSIIYLAAWEFNWWREVGLFGWDDRVPIPWVNSAYLVVTIWIFAYTFERFWVYLLTNIVLDSAYIFLWYPIQERLGMASGELSPFITLLMMLTVSIIIYLYQLWYESGRDYRW